jgi:hypothetical protein
VKEIEGDSAQSSESWVVCEGEDGEEHFPRKAMARGDELEGGHEEEGSASLTGSNKDKGRQRTYLCHRETSERRLRIEGRTERRAGRTRWAKKDGELDTSALLRPLPRFEELPWTHQGRMVLNKVKGLLRELFASIRAKRGRRSMMGVRWEEAKTELNLPDSPFPAEKSTAPPREGNLALMEECTTSTRPTGSKFAKEAP